MNTDRILDIKDIKADHTYIRVTRVPHDVSPITVDLVNIKRPRWSNYGSLFFYANTYRVNPESCERVSWDTKFSAIDYNIAKSHNGYNFHGVWKLTGDNLSTILNLQTEEDYVNLWRLPVKKAELRETIRLERERAKNYLQASEKFVRLLDEKHDKAREAIENAEAAEKELAQLG